MAGVTRAEIEEQYDTEIDEEDLSEDDEEEEIMNYQRHPLRNAGLVDRDNMNPNRLDRYDDGTESAEDEDIEAGEEGGRRDADQVIREVIGRVSWMWVIIKHLFQIHFNF